MSLISISHPSAIATQTEDTEFQETALSLQLYQNRTQSQISAFVKEIDGLRQQLLTSHQRLELQKTGQQKTLAERKIQVEQSRKKVVDMQQNMAAESKKMNQDIEAVIAARKSSIETAVQAADAQVIKTREETTASCKARLESEFQKIIASQGNELERKEKQNQADLQKLGAHWDAEFRRIQAEYHRGIAEVNTSYTGKYKSFIENHRFKAAALIKKDDNGNLVYNIPQYPCRQYI